MDKHNPHDVEQHVRLSGSPGVRARQTSASGTVHQSRVSGVPSHGAVRTVPIATLTAVRELLVTWDDNVRPARAVLTEIHELLSDWL